MEKHHKVNETPLNMPCFFDLTHVCAIKGQNKIILLNKSDWLKKYLNFELQFFVVCQEALDLSFASLHVSWST